MRNAGTTKNEEVYAKQFITSHVVEPSTMQSIGMFACGVLLPQWYYSSRSCLKSECGRQLQIESIRVRCQSRCMLLRFRGRVSWRWVAMLSGGICARGRRRSREAFRSEVFEGYERQ